MTKKEADKENKKIQKIFEDLQKKYTLEEIADAMIFPVYRSDEEEKQDREELTKAIAAHRKANPLNEEDKKAMNELADKFRKEDEVNKSQGEHIRSKRRNRK